jgi:hypothetical protein
LLVVEPDQHQQEQQDDDKNDFRELFRVHKSVAQSIETRTMSVNELFAAFVVLLLEPAWQSSCEV